MLYHHCVTCERILQMATRCRYLTPLTMVLPVGETKTRSNMRVLRMPAHQQNRRVSPPLGRQLSGAWPAC